MDAKLKTKWLDALRSGKYEQGTGYLRLNNRYCCLGVACDVLNPKKWIAGDSGEHVYIYEGDEGLCVWSPAVETRFGLSYKQSHTLWSMNDEGKSFDEIADYIEAKL